MTTDLRGGSKMTRYEGPIGRDDDDDFDSEDEFEDEPSAAENEAKAKFVQGELAGVMVNVPVVKKWRSSALKAMKDGDFETWAQVTLDDEGWAHWQETDPTIEDIEGFFADINPKLGTSPGNSRASRRASARTRRR